MLDKNGYPYIIDFGIAKDFNYSYCKEFSGTPGYMAPEVISKRSQCNRVDFFSLGIILYEILIRKRPFVSTDKRAYCQDLLAHEAKLPNISNFSPQITDFINKVTLYL